MSSDTSTSRRDNNASMPEVDYDCVVVGSGHAGSCAAYAAVESGCKNVLIVDKCPPEWVGGNGYFTAGAHRTVHGGLHDLLPIVRGVSPEQAQKIDMDPYTVEDFTRDIMRLGDWRSDPILVKTMVEGSRDAVGWLAEKIQVPYVFSFNRQAYEVDGRHVFWGGMVLATEDGGKGLIAAHRQALQRIGVQTWFNCPATKLIVKEGKIEGLEVKKEGQKVRLRTTAVVLACGGYESSADLRRKHLGPGWAKAKVRGTPYNTGDGFKLAEDVGARLAGDWQGCHSTTWDANAPSDAGDRTVTNQFTKSGYPLGIMVNARGLRFVDEGEDFRNYTYAKFGRAILEQEDGYAFQIYDARVTPWLRKEEYGDDVVEKIHADNLDELADKLVEMGMKDRERFVQTVVEYNDAVGHHQEEKPDEKWDPAIKDGLSTQSTQAKLNPPKSNWALPLDSAPFVAVKVCGAITFTFGGLAIDPDTANVLSRDGTPIPGLFATGEAVGGLFFGNYPGGSGLTAGAVFARKAGLEAAKLSGRQ